MKPIVLVIGLLLAASPAYPAAEDSLGVAKDLYASAAYEEALAMLNRLDEAAGAGDAARVVDQYRAFCMFALGRTSEAESMAESVIRREPLAPLDPADASPRIQTMFTGVRRRLLPSLIRERFREAKASFDIKDFSAAESPLVNARHLIAQAEELNVNDQALADLRVLVEGYLQLIRAATPEETAASRIAMDGADATPPPPDTQSTPASAPASRRIYSVADEGVSPPITIDQRMPPIPVALAKITRSAGRTGIIDLVIDETGAVVDVIVRVSIHAALDRLVAETASRWRYEPAMKDGTPVQFVKTIAFVGQ
jgi:TonB family protein